MNKRQRKKRDKKNLELMLQFCEGLKNLSIAAKECAYNIRKIFKPKDGNDGIVHKILVNHRT